jgi:hypothetical protein
MAKTLAEKLFIKPGYRMAILNAPEGYLAELSRQLPEGVATDTALNGTYDMVQYFTTHQAALTPDIDALKTSIRSGGMLWLCYPKGGDKAKISTDLNRDKLWKLLESLGLTPNHQISIDETWSAIRFKVVG